MGRRSGHGLRVQRLEDPPHPVGLQAGANRRLQHDVGVAPSQSASPGVKRSGHHPRPLHRHVRWQMAVGAPHPSGFGPDHFGVEMRHLEGAMDARIGAARTQNRGGRAVHEQTQRPLQPVLNGAAAGLALPPLVRGAVVGQAESNSQSAGQPRSAKNDLAFSFRRPDACSTTSSARERAPSRSPMAMNSAARDNLVSRGSPSGMSS